MEKDEALIARPTCSRFTGMADKELVVHLLRLERGQTAARRSEPIHHLETKLKLL